VPLSRRNEVPAAAGLRSGAGLAESLKTQTRSLHTTLERGPLMSSLLRGKMPRVPYCALLRNLHVVYAALEPALLRHAAHPGVAPVVFTALFRSQALAEDLSELHGAAWQQEIASTPAARRYAQHLHDIATDRPVLLVAHAYVRYLGDLSGGQMLRRIVADALSLADGRGTRFYDFGEPAEVVVHLRAFRAGLAQLDHGDEQAAAIVAEAVGSFQRHQELFDELAGVPGSPEAAAVNPAN
jgi:heme oxygenase (biliverdin-producing, ferredoxin)